jgi:hypothetical protein
MDLRQSLRENRKVVAIALGVGLAAQIAQQINQSGALIARSLP